MGSVTHERLKELLSYDPLTGHFRWLRKTCNHHNNFKSEMITTKDSKGYRIVKIDGRQYRLHQIAWCYMTGSFSEIFIDHINGDKSDNRFDNLREATGSQNQWNTTVRRDNKSGFKGVSFKDGKWRARCAVKGKTFELGRFSNIEDAVKAVHFFREVNHESFYRHK